MSFTGCRCVLGNTPVVSEKGYDLYPLPRNVPGNEVLYGRVAPYQGMPTGMSLKANRLLVTTYRDAYLYDYDDVTKNPRGFRCPKWVSVSQHCSVRLDLMFQGAKIRNRSRGHFRVDFGFAAPAKGGREMRVALHQFCGGSWRINAGIHLQS